MSWWLPLILFCWVSIHRLLLLSLQVAHTLFLYFLWAVHTNASSVSEHERQSPEAISMSELSTLPLDNSELEARSSVLSGLPAMGPPTWPVVALEGLGGLAGSHPPCSEVTGSSFLNNLGVSWLPRVELDSIPASTLGAEMGPLVWWWSGKLLRELSHFPQVGMARKSEKGKPTKGVSARVMSARKDTGRGEVPGGGVRPPGGPGSGSHEALDQVQAQDQMKWDGAQIQWGCPCPV